MIPNGIQQHALHSMDGRTWIEPYFPTDDPKKQRLRELKIEKGWMRLIPQDKVEEFVKEVM